jgi:hypothetical protein
LSSEFCHLPTHSVHESPHLRHRPSQIGIARDLPVLCRASSCGSCAAHAYLGRHGRRFEANFSQWSTPSGALPRHVWRGPWEGWLR